MYLVSTSSSLEGAHPDVGLMTTPNARIRRPLDEGRAWAADNGAFTGKYTEAKFLAFLQRMTAYAGTCLFVTVPDVLHDPQATAALWATMSARLRPLGLPLAFVAQTGCEAVPEDADWLFLAGDDTWRFGPQGRALVAQARARGMQVHVGRVNSRRRMVLCEALGADTADGTHLRFRGAARGLSDVAGWIEATYEVRAA